MYLRLNYNNSVMCVICEKTILLNRPLDQDDFNFENKSKEPFTIKCNHCPTITSIPCIPGLCVLICSYCPQLKEIAVIPGLKKLVCMNNPELIEIPFIQGLKQLYCSGVWKLKNIPMIDSLETLDCSFNKNIESVPKISGLKKLDVRYCKKLVKIPWIQGLRELDCQGCESLKKISPRNNNLKYMNCNDCRSLINITQIDDSANEILYLVQGCLWLKNDNLLFDDNIKKLVILQRWSKRIIMAKKIFKLIPKIIPFL